MPPTQRRAAGRDRRQRRAGLDARRSRYRVRGIEKNSQLRAVEGAGCGECGESFHVDTVELYPAKQRLAWVKAASDRARRRRRRGAAAIWASCCGRSSSGRTVDPREAETARMRRAAPRVAAGAARCRAGAAARSGSDRAHRGRCRSDRRGRRGRAMRWSRIWRACRASSTSRWRS